MPVEAPTLPLELGDISDNRREQLEVRRQREMARQQEQSQSRMGNGNFRWSPIAMIPAHLCVLIFLVFLLEKLEERLRWPWAAVLSPLWFTDAVFIIIKSKEVRQILRTSVHMPSEAYALFPPLGGIIDHLGVAAAKATLAYRLEDKVDWSLLLLFTPMWVCVALAGALRCITPPGPQVMGEQVTLHRAGSFFGGLFHLVARGAQPILIVLKVDGQLEGPWSSVFIPLWLFMGVIALGGSALCCCAPMVSRGVIPEIRPLLIRGMLLCSVGTFSLALCALLFLVFLTLELDGNENMPPRTILAPLIALYALILVFLPLLLLVTRHYVRTMRTAEEQFRQANDPSGVDGSSTFGGVGEEGEAGTRFQRPGADGAVPRDSAAGATPTILMRESSTLFRRASVSFCRRLGEADGSLINTDIMPFELTDWNRRVSSRSRHSERGSGATGPQRSSRSFHGLQDLLPQAAGMVSRGGQRFTAAVTGTSGRESRARFAMSTERQRAAAEKEGSPGQDERDEEVSKDERHDRGLLQGDSGTHSVTDSYDLNSYGSYIDSDEENHEVGLSIDGDEDEEGRDGVDLDLRVGGNSSSHPPPPTPSPEILLAFGSAHGAAAFSLHGAGGGSSSGHGTNAAHRWSVGRDATSRHGSLHGVSRGGGMPRRVSWPSGMTAADVLLDGRGDSAMMRDTEAGWAGGVGLGGSAGREQPACYICCERRADAVVMECGHGGMCFTCATHLANTPPSLCPVCRKTISEVLTFGGVVTVSGGGGLVGGVGGERKSPVDDLPSTGAVPNVPASASVAAVPPSASSVTAPTGTGARIGSGTFRRFSGPDVVGASAAVAGGGAVQGGRAVREGGPGDGRGGVQRPTSPPGARDSTHRDLEAQGMSQDGGWLDPV